MYSYVVRPRDTVVMETRIHGTRENDYLNAKSERRDAVTESGACRAGQESRPDPEIIAYPRSSSATRSAKIQIASALPTPRSNCNRSRPNRDRSVERVTERLDDARLTGPCSDISRNSRFREHEHDHHHSGEESLHCFVEGSMEKVVVEKS